MVRDVFGNTRGAISILAALMLTVVVGISALAVEFGHGLLTRVENQRIADFAAHAGALVYNSTSTTSTANSVVLNVASLNGLSSGASSSVVSSPTGDGNNAVEVTVSTSVPLLLARVLTTNTTLPVSATAYAEINPTSPGCIIALSGSGSGVTVTSAASITADNCTVASNAVVTASSASTITTKTVDYGTSYSTSSASSINPPTGTASVTYKKTTTSDPLASNTEVTGATARLSSVSSITSPTVPSGGTAVSFSASTMTGSLPAGCTKTSSGSNFTINCTGSGPYQFGALSVLSTASLTFNTSAGTTYVFSGGITVDSSSNATFGAGTYEIGAGTSAATTYCGAAYCICNNSSASLTFNGPDTFTLAGGIYNGSASTLAMGSGTSSANSYNIGASAGNSIDNVSATPMTFGNATSGSTQTCGSSSSTFCLAGSITNGSSATLTLPAAAEHDIDGNLYGASASTTTLGAGIYTVAGYVEVLSSTTVNASGVTLVIGGANTSSEATPCTGMALCVDSASGLTLTAPTSGATEDLAVIGPTSSSNTSGALISAAGSSSVSGAFYFPNGAVSVSSASGLGNGSGQCLELIGSHITVTSASGVGSTCAGLGGSTSGTTISLVQ
jgi:Putative Flp pilus-assembly TadE/G-like